MIFKNRPQFVPKDTSRFLQRAVSRIAGALWFKKMNEELRVTSAEEDFHVTIHESKDCRSTKKEEKESRSSDFVEHHTDDLNVLEHQNFPVKENGNILNISAMFELKKTTLTNQKTNFHLKRE